MSFHFLTVLRFLLCVTRRQVVMDKCGRRKPRKEKGERGSAASFSFVVSDQAICKHEGAVLGSWQKGGKDENDNTEIETNETGE